MRTVWVGLFSFFGLCFLFLNSKIYWDKYVIREREYNTTLNAVAFCKNAEMVRSMGMEATCNQKEDDSRKDPVIYAAADVLCVWIPCSLFNENQKDSIAGMLVDTISALSFKFIVITFALLFIFSIVRGIWNSHVSYNESKSIVYLPMNGTQISTWPSDPNRMHDPLTYYDGPRTLAQRGHSLPMLASSRLYELPKEKYQ